MTDHQPCTTTSGLKLVENRLLRGSISPGAKKPFKKGISKVLVSGKKIAAMEDLSKVANVGFVGFCVGLPQPEDSPGYRATVPTCVAAVPWPLCPLSEDCCTPPPPTRDRITL